MIEGRGGYIQYFCSYFLPKDPCTKTKEKWEERKENTEQSRESGRGREGTIKINKEIYVRRDRDKKKIDTEKLQPSTKTHKIYRSKIIINNSFCSFLLSFFKLLTSL